MGITNLSIHTGKTKKLRIQEATPTDPTPTTGDIYIDSSAPSQALGIFGATSWQFIILQAA